MIASTVKTKSKRNGKPGHRALRFTPYAWAKLLYLRDIGPTEVGGFGISNPDDLLLVEDIELVQQDCTSVSVQFDDDSVADFFDRQVDVGFVGSCTNGRISDIRAAANVLRGRRVSPHVRMLVVPGSEVVRKEAESEGLDKIITEAGAEWRLPGCSMCIAMNGDAIEACKGFDDFRRDCGGVRKASVGARL